jgi:hypothetical protein
MALTIALSDLGCGASGNRKTPDQVTPSSPRLTAIGDEEQAVALLAASGAKPTEDLLLKNDRYCIFAEGNRLRMRTADGRDATIYFDPFREELQPATNPTTRDYGSLPFIMVGPAYYKNLPRILTAFEAALELAPNTLLPTPPARITGTAAFRTMGEFDVNLP